MAVGFSAGTFGGGSGLVSPTFGSFSGRSDFDALAVWTLQNAGVGNAAWWRQRRAQIGQTSAERLQTLNLVRAEVAAARADAAARRREVDFAARQLQIAELGFLAEARRARANEGLPIEELNMVTLLIEAREDLIRSVIEYDQAEFRLYVAMGWPPPTAAPVAPPKDLPNPSAPPGAVNGP